MVADAAVVQKMEDAAVRLAELVGYRRDIDVVGVFFTFYWAKKSSFFSTLLVIQKIKKKGLFLMPKKVLRIVWNVEKFENLDAQKSLKGGGS